MKYPELIKAYDVLSSVFKDVILVVERQRQKCAFLFEMKSERETITGTAFPCPFSV